MVAPSWPGYGWSSPTVDRGWDPKRIALAFAALRDRLGYDGYLAQGGDWGSMISTQIGLQDPDHCAGIHLNMIIAVPGPDDEMPEEETQALTDAITLMSDGAGSQAIQGTKPQTLGYGLNDSPAGLAGWIAKKQGVKLWMTRGEMLTARAIIADSSDNAPEEMLAQSRAAGWDEAALEAARSMGVDSARYKTFAFALSAGMTGLAGVLYAHKLSFISPEMFTLALSLEFVMIIIIGGIGSIRGALVGSLIVGTVDTLGRALLPTLLRAALPADAAATLGPALASILIYLLMAAILFFRPQGLFPARA